MPPKKQAAVGREVVSLDSLAQQKRDALPEPSIFSLKGVEFTLPPMRSLPFELQERVGNLEDIPAVLKDILGDDKVKEMYAADYTFLDIELIAQEWQKRGGTEPGESPASSDS
ncbi:hypothetical protein PV396_24380 [Streptomyces sp. ME02-8801-2C]|uniref:hypothetical protein n=1 Tax=Streptomyces sp. ME02-8801-2C TaxID=3028680 RepID=UPI0029B08FB4|nr:hypothetical protein [Streptomyces sp. ME02-8801-2C]MDX3455039.1 hypothetical protein [Streptomyces sp. ME02-8801-2C]